MRVELDNSSDELVTRSSTSLEPAWDRFIPNPQKITTTVNKKTTEATKPIYNSQYSQLYRSRLEQLRARMINTIENNKIRIIPRIIELGESEQECIVIGTIDRTYSSLPNDIFEDHLNNTTPLSLETSQNFSSDQDVLILEDESGRIELCFPTDQFKVEINHLTTGVVIGVCGVVQESTSVFQVSQVFYPTLGVPSIPNTTPSGKIALISGLNFGLLDTLPNESQSLRRALLIDYLAGNIHNTHSSAQISRVIIAGGNLRTAPHLLKKASDAIQNLRELDLFLSELCANGVPTAMLPGRNDATNANYPYRPLHSCLFRNTSKCYSNLLQLPCNPMDCTIDSRRILGTDGTNILNYMQYTQTSSPLEALEWTVKFNLIVPTAPDTLPSIPSFGEMKNDPTVMLSLPHLYFCGNCAQFETKIVQNSCRLVCIPDFSKTGEIALFDLDTLECDVVQIQESF